MNIPDEAVEAAGAAYLAHPSKRCVSNPSDAMRAALEAAAPHLIADTVADILEGMQAWAGDKELGFLEGYSDASVDAVTRSAGVE